MPEHRIRVAVLDDHQVVADGIVAYAKHHPEIEVVRVFNHGISFTTQLDQCDFEVLLCDLSVPGMNGFSVCDEVKRRYPERKVLFFSRHGGGEVVEEVKRSRADGFVPKDAGMTEVVKTIVQVMKGEKVFRFDLIPRNQSGMPQSSNVLKINHVPVNATPFEKFQTILTPSERTIMAMYGKGMDKKEIAKALELSVQTVDTHRKRIYKKMDVENIQGLMRACWDCGLM